MGLSQAQLEEMKATFGNSLTSVSDAGVEYVLIPSLKLPDGCVPAEVEALLCPTPRDGYESRLFFSVLIHPGHPSGIALNWNANGVRIAERVWHAYSWKVATGLRLTQAVAAHLKALR
jgi:hypothetical protein